jgi:rhodanese-related sulfurtransferase
MSHELRKRGTSPRPLGATTITRWLADGKELALIDLREELVFSQGHLLHARSVPLSRLELMFARMVPRRTTRIVLMDDGDGLVARAADILGRAGYTDLSYLDGGVGAWGRAGYELFSGVNVPSKAFGEFIEHASGTPSISADELHQLMRKHVDMVVVDSRPFGEYRRVSIPSATNVPGAELVYRIHDVAPSPDTLIVVNCAGRTRSIIGAQSLINAGVPNKVVALRNGTMGWHLAGLVCDSGKSARAPAPSPDGLAFAKAAAARVAKRVGVERITGEQLEGFRADKDRTLYLLDVRDPDEYAAGHVAGACSAPGGQLVQATDLYVGTLGSRIVLTDDMEVRAVMTASWLKQMGWREVFVLVDKGDETAAPAPELLGTPAPAELQIAPAALRALQTLAASEATVIDLSLSTTYRKGHIPSAWFAIRARLKPALAKIPLRGTVVLTSEDGALASLAQREAAELCKVPVRVLAGGNAAWTAAGYSLEEKPHMADEPLDVWLRPYERTGDTAGAMREYLTWETDLLPRIERDGSCKFARLL